MRGELPICPACGGYHTEAQCGLVITAKKPTHAPMQGAPHRIPWEMHLRAYAVYCTRCGPQPALIDLAGRNCRGGFHASELDQFIPGWRDELT